MHAHIIQMVRLLFKRVQINAQNLADLTALDILEDQLEGNLI